MPLPHPAARQGPCRPIANISGSPSPTICHAATIPVNRGSHSRAQPVLPYQLEQELRLLSRARLCPTTLPGTLSLAAEAGFGDGVPEGVSIVELWLSSEQGLLVGALATSLLSCSICPRSGYSPHAYAYALPQPYLLDCWPPLLSPGCAAALPCSTHLLYGLCPTDLVVWG